VTSNGHRPREWKPTRLFHRRRAEIAPHVPRLSEILTAVEEELTLRAESSRGSARLSPGEDNWLHETEASEDNPDEAPALWIFYKVESTRVRPRWIDLAERHIPTDLTFEDDDA
jgi:hypothetical protein